MLDVICPKNVINSEKYNAYKDKAIQHNKTDIVLTD